MRILLVTQQWTAIRSGVGSFSQMLARGLLRAGVALQVLAPRERGLPGAPLDAVPVQRVAASARYGGQQRWLWLAHAWGRSLRQGAARGCQLVHFSDARERLFSPRTFPTLGSVHDTYAGSCPRWPWQWRERYRDALPRWLWYRGSFGLERRAYEGCTGLVANSAFTRSELQRAYGLKAPIEVVRNAVDPAPVQHHVEPRAGVLRPFRIVFSGGNPERKGLPTLLAAAVRLARSLPLELWILGHGQPGSTWQENLRVRRFGLLPRERAWRLMCRADVLCVPSQIEALGLVYMEAMAAGMPVVASARGGAPEVIEHGRDGMLVAPRDAAGLCLQLSDLLQNPALRAALGTRAAERAAAWSVDALAARYISIYQRMLA